MKKFLTILVLSLLWCNTSFPSYNISGKYYGKGPLKINKNTADILEYYFSGGTKGKYAKEQKRRWIPFFFVISPDGKHYSYFINTHGPNVDINPHYVGQAKSRCKKKSGQECFVFANGYSIVWKNENVIDKKKRRLKKKDIKAGKTLQILQELGFYDGGTTQTKKKEPKKKMNEDVVQQLKDLNELYKSGVLTKEEFEKAKKKLLN